MPFDLIVWKCAVRQTYLSLTPQLNHSQHQEFLLTCTTSCLTLLAKASVLSANQAIVIRINGLQKPKDTSPDMECLKLATSGQSNVNGNDAHSKQTLLLLQTFLNRAITPSILF